MGGAGAATPAGEVKQNIQREVSNAIENNPAEGSKQQQFNGIHCRARASAFVQRAIVSMQSSCRHPKSPAFDFSLCRAILFAELCHRGLMISG